MIKPIVIISFLTFFLFSAFSEDPLVVEYFFRPPFYFTEDSVPRGFLLERVRQILEHSKIDFIFKELPSNRILYDIKNEESNVCSIGWFYTESRATYANYSLSIYQDSPQIALFCSLNSSRFSTYRSLNDLIHDESLTIGILNGYSYGKEIDESLSSISLNKEVINGTEVNLIKMLKTGRIDYMLCSPEEVDHLIKMADLDVSDFSRMNLNDVQVGNQRYIIYSSSVDDEIITRIDHAIRDFREIEISGIKN